MIDRVGKRRLRGAQPWNAGRECPTHGWANGERSPGGVRASGAVTRGGSRSHRRGLNGLGSSFLTVGTGEKDGTFPFPCPWMTVLWEPKGLGNFFILINSEIYMLSIIS